MRVTGRTFLFLVSAMLLASLCYAAPKVRFNAGKSIMKKSSPIDPDFRSVIQVGAPPAWAQTDAQRMAWAVDEGRQRGLLALAFALGDVYLTSDRTIEKERLENRHIEAAVQQVVRYAEEVEWEQVPLAGEKGYGFQITMQVPRFGPYSLASLFYPELRREAAEEEKQLGRFEVPEAPPPSPTPAPASEAPKPAYTGLVIDARGTNLIPALAPKILSESGQIVYNIMDSYYAETTGVVGYGRDLDHPASLRERAGGNPLELRALRRAGTSDVVMSDEMAAQILYENVRAKPHFLSECRVIFLVD